MSFYAKLEFNQKQLDREYVITAAGKTYRINTQTADIKFDEAGLLIFTTPENYRVALNIAKIDSIIWDISMETNKQ